jgi:hypothetical protein
VNVSQIQPLQGTSTYRQQLGIADDAVVALYSGSLGAKHGLALIPQAARQLGHLENLVFVVCGNGVFKPQLEAAAAELPNLRLLPLQPLERLGELLGLADIHLLPQSPGAEDLVMPSKLSGMLASGRPVVATCRPDTELASVVNQAGLVVPPEDGGALALAIEQLAHAPALRAELGAAGRAYAESQLMTEAVLGRFDADLAALVAAPMPGAPPRSVLRPQYGLGLGLKKIVALTSLSLIPLASLAPSPESTAAAAAAAAQQIALRMQAGPAKLARSVTTLDFGAGRAITEPTHSNLPEPTTMLLALAAAVAAFSALRYRHIQ